MITRFPIKLFLFYDPNNNFYSFSYILSFAIYICIICNRKSPCKDRRMWIISNETVRKYFMRFHLIISNIIYDAFLNPRENSNEKCLRRVWNTSDDCHRNVNHSEDSIPFIRDFAVSYIGNLLKQNMSAKLVLLFYFR